MKFRYLLFVTLFALAACASAEPAGPRTLVMMTHDSFAISEGIFEDFQAAHNATVRVLTVGDAGLATNLAILNKEAPLADVFYGIDNTLLTRGLEAGIFEAYESPLLANIPEEFQLDPENGALPVDYGDVCLNYDKAFFEEQSLALPDSLEVLTDPVYRGLLVVENPASSSPGLAFLLATVAHFGEEGFLDYWQALRENDVKIVENWEAAYYTEFSGSSGRGPRPLVVSYASSPPAEVIYAEEPLDEAPTGSLVGEDMCYRQIEFVGILKGTQNRELAEAWVDFMLSREFQEDIPLQMFVFPVNSEAQLPEVFVKHAQIATKPATVDPAAIAAHREEWIEAWTATMLR